ncbi:MAG: RNase adapter RapZ, partial [Firmicutes bacterium]|nr:RNase adapter RapZ [Bacillota bacterium]
KPLDMLMFLDVFSFGFKYGAPIDADIIFDARFVPNPYWVSELKHTTGLDAKCSDYVFQEPIASYFVKTASEMLVRLIPHYSSEGKSRLTIGIGCSGGQHRSVAIAERLVKMLREAGVNCQARHREIAAGHVAVEDLEGECVAP